jgi:hypothetical protein
LQCLGERFFHLIDFCSKPHDSIYVSHTNNFINFSHGSHRNRENVN